MPLIILAEDECGVRSVVSQGLKLDGHEVLEVADGHDCLSAVHRHRPDLLVLDIEMPGLDGLEVCRRLRADATFQHLPIIFMTGYTTPADVIGGLEIGGDDYITKPLEIEVLRARTQALLRRSGRARRGDRKVLVAEPFAMDRAGRIVRVEGREVELTPTEERLLYFLLSNAGKVFSSEDLLQLVWGYPYGIGEKATVRQCVKNLREKIEERPTDPAWLLTMKRKGYTLRTSETCVRL